MTTIGVLSISASAMPDLGTLQRLIGCIDVQDYRGLGVIVLAGGGVTIHLG